MWSSLFATVNAYNIRHILEERHSSVHMTDKQEKVFVTFFMPHGVTPKQFERIDKKAKYLKLKKGHFLVRKGDQLNKVYLIIEGSTQAHILGRRLTAASTNDETRGDQKEGGDSGAWAGEMAFLKRFWENEQRKVIRGDKDEESTSKGDEEKGRILTRTKSGKPASETAETAFYTIIAAEDCTVLSWSHEDLEELMETSVDMRSAMTRAMSSALVGKVVNLTISRTHEGKVPWLVWLTERKSKDGTNVHVSEELRLAEDRA
jgi:CRP-like cAMP-binding protein